MIRPTVKELSEYSDLTSDSLEDVLDLANQISEYLPAFKAQIIGLDYLIDIRKDEEKKLEKQAQDELKDKLFWSKHRGFNDF